jgi:hypothetical protein
LALFYVTALAQAQTPTSRDIRLSMYGLGPVRIGMDVTKASAASGWSITGDLNKSSEGCWYAKAPEEDGVRFMVEDGVISRIDIERSRYTTVSGIRIGDTEQHAKEIYGASLVIVPDKYDPTGHDLIIRSRDRRYALVLETDGRVVTQIHAGKEPSAEYVEGCL